MTNCKFTSNLGNALAISETDVTVIDCLFEGNQGHGVVGTLAQFDISRSAFIRNSGTALSLNSSRLATVEDCVFIGNSGIYGGAISSSYSDGSVTISDCVFWNNSATMGGAVYASWALSVKISDCVFANNSATEGGALYFSYPLKRYSLAGCTLYDNSASVGGGVYCGEAFVTPALTVDNTIIAFGSQGEAVYCTNSGSEHGDEVTSGIYFARLSFGSELRSHKLVLLK
jgi:predicted outer membrane repeat protein